MGEAQMNVYRYEDMGIGHKEEFTMSITADMEDSFREITKDVNPLHQDDVFAREMGQKSHVAFGMLTASLLSTLAGVYIPGKYSLIHSVEIGFVKPVFVGDELTVTGTVSDKVDTLKLIHLKVRMKNQKGQVVCKAKMKIVVNK